MTSVIVSGKMPRDGRLDLRTKQSKPECCRTGRPQLSLDPEDLPVPAAPAACRGSAAWRIYKSWQGPTGFLVSKVTGPLRTRHYVGWITEVVAIFRLNVLE